MIKYLEFYYKGKTLRGMLHKGKFSETIIIVHGYLSSNKIGPYRLYFEIAEFLRELGFSVIRVDLSGMGESDGDILSVDFDDHVYELLYIVEHVREIQKTDNIHLLGHCIGCSTVLKCYTLSKYCISSVVLIAPFFPGKSQFVKLLGNEEIYNSVINEKIAYRNGYPFRKSFLDAAYVIENRLLVDRIRNNSIIFNAAKDQICSVEDMIKWCIDNSIKYEIIENADHNFVNKFARSLLLDKLGNWYLRKDNATDYE